MSKRTSTPAPRRMIDPGSVSFTRALTVLAAVLIASAFAVSATALVEVARWANVAAPMRWVIAVLLDAGILIFIAAALHARHEGRRHATAFAWTAVAVLTLTSAGLNALHALDAGATEWRGVAGVILAGLPPLMVWSGTHVLATIYAATPRELTARRAAAEAAVVAAEQEADARADREAQAAEAARERAAQAAIAEARRRARVAAAEAEAAAEAAAAEARAEADAETARVRASARVEALEARVHPTPEALAPTEPDAEIRPAVAAAASPRPAVVTAPADDELREQVLALAAEGASQRGIAETLGIGRKVVHRILTDATETTSAA